MIITFDYYVDYSFSKKKIKKTVRFVIGTNGENELFSKFN